MKWQHFSSARLLGGALSLKMGTPPFTMAADIVLSVLWQMRKERGEAGT